MGLFDVSMAPTNRLFKDGRLRQPTRLGGGVGLGGTGSGLGGGLFFSSVRIGRCGWGLGDLCISNGVYQKE